MTPKSVTIIFSALFCSLALWGNATPETIPNYISQSAINFSEEIGTPIGDWNRADYATFLVSSYEENDDPFFLLKDQTEDYDDDSIAILDWSEAYLDVLNPQSSIALDSI